MSAYYIDALCDVIESLKRGSCWCEMGIGNPMFTSHTQACERARAAVESREKMIEAEAETLASIIQDVGNGL